MRIEKNSFVVIEYTLRLEDGSFIKGENGPASMNFIAGYGQILPALEAKLMGLEEGAEKELMIPAREAIGESDPNLIKIMALSDFPAGRELKPGRWALAKNQSTGAQYSYFVREKTDAKITIDYNHPLAGKDLYYHLKVVLVRAALDEELEFVRPCEHGQAPSQED